MSEKQKIIEKMIQMQKQFIARERKSGVKQEDYFFPQAAMFWMAIAKRSTS